MMHERLVLHFLTRRGRETRNTPTLRTLVSPGSRLRLLGTGSEEDLPTRVGD